MSTAKHAQSKQDAHDEANGDIPLNRELFYDMENCYIDQETGQPYPDSTVFVRFMGLHSVDSKANTMQVRIGAKLPFNVVEAERCDLTHGIHFVRIAYYPGNIPILTSYVWDESH